MTTEERFHAAVNVIRSLPKNGSYQPSNELMLRFYAYYKQATEGPCAEAKTSKPAFWDVVGRAKHTAWARLKNMAREDAMQRYVDELHRIVETMSYTDNVATFMQAGDQEVLDSLPMDDLELVAGDCLQYVRSQPGSPLASRPSSPAPSSPAIPAQPDSDDEYIDTEEPDPEVQLGKHPLTNGISMESTDNNTTYSIPNGAVSRGASVINKQRSQSDLSAEVARIVASLQTDIRTIDNRVAGIEQAMSSTKAARTVTFTQLSPALLAFLIVWPILVIRFSRRWSQQK